VHGFKGIAEPGALRSDGLPVRHGSVENRPDSS
jgi:hypothetical protein